MGARQRECPDKLGLYIHIPFCRSKCDYCDFYSLAGREDLMAQYQKALLIHLKETAPLTAGIAVDSIYFGGGTPSYYGEKRLRELLVAMKRHFSIAPDAEITLEANPDSVSLSGLRSLYKAGFNRLSLGMQSAQPDELASLHRTHTIEQLDCAVAAAKQAGFSNLSLDLIYGLPGQTLQRWKQNVQHALSLAPRHLSCYGLKLEPDTPLARRVTEGECLPDDDEQADWYLWTVAQLERAGYPQYEISNFAQTGFESRHNLRYWLLRPYIGFGPGAHSDFGGCRYSWIRDLEGYLSGISAGGSVLASHEMIPQRERGGEYLLLRLRTAQGIEELEYSGQYSLDFHPIEARLLEFQAQGWSEKTPDGRWRLTPTGFLLSNQLIGDLLQRQEQAPLSRLRPRMRARVKGAGRD